MNRPNESKNHHYVPQSYLKRFDKKQLWVFDKDERKVYRTNIRNISSEMHFNKIDEETPYDNLDPLFIEKMFSLLEGKYKDALSKIIHAANTQNIYEDDLRRCIAGNIYIQYLRTRRARDVIHESEKNSKIIQFYYLFNAESIWNWINQLIDYTWIIKTVIDDKILYTSDNPVVFYSEDNKDDVTILSPGVEIALPLSSKLILLLREPTFPLKNDSHNMTDADVILYNALQIIQSHRCIYSSTNDFSLVGEIFIDNPYDMTSKRGLNRKRD